MVNRQIIWLFMLLGMIPIIVLTRPVFAQIPTANPIIVENQQPGSDLWQLDRPGFKTATDQGGQIKGYASATSVNPGETISFFITVSPILTYAIDIFRIGWYDGKGGRLMQHVGPQMGIHQPACPMSPDTGLLVCNWQPSYALTVPITWTSGIYLALLTNAQNYQNYIIFVVRDDARQADLLYQQSVTTYQAYNIYPSGSGKSLYDFNSTPTLTKLGTWRAVKVSFDRPYTDDGAGLFLSWEVYFIRWLERNGYDVTYSTDVDTHARGSWLTRYKAFLSVGHDEYWSKEMYDAVEAARDAGTHLGFFGANAVYWQFRFEPSAHGAANRIMACYKDAKLDPMTDSRLKTVRWRDAPVNRPEQQLVGIQYGHALTMTNGAYTVVNSSNWVYTGTGFHDGDTVPGIVGYEIDRLMPEYSLPLSRTFTLLSQSVLPDAQKTTDDANSVIYQSPGGAWVFAAGTISWSWGLDKPGIMNSGIQRTTANILNRFIYRQLATNQINRIYLPLVFR